MPIAIQNGVNIQGGCLFESYLNTYIASLSPQIWLKFDEAFSSGNVWTTGSWINSGSASVSPTSYGGNVTGAAGITPLSSKSAINVGGTPATTATFAAQYTPNANTTYYNQTITVNMTVTTNSDFRSNPQGNWFWHQGATGASNNQGLSVAYSPNGGNDILTINYFNGGWVQPIITPNIMMLNDTTYNFTFVYSPTGGTGFGYVKFYINGVPQSTINLTIAIPNTAYKANFGCRALSDTSAEVKGWFTMDNCLLWNRELTAQEIFTLSSLSLASPCDYSFSDVSLLLPMNGVNASTTFTDYSPSPNTVTPNGNAQISTAQSKWNGSSGYFDGSGDFLSISGTLPTTLQLGGGDFTIEFYVYTTSTTTQFICGNLKDDAGSGSYWVILNSTYTGLHTVQFGIEGASFKFGTSTLTTNAWQYIAITRSGSSLRCFLNGTQLGTTGTISNFTGTLSNEFRIASATPGIIGFNYFLNGYMNDLRITKGVARYTANFTPPNQPFPTQSC